MKANKIRAIIVDDEKDARNLLMELLKEFEEINVIANFANVDDALAFISTQTPDLLFLDIQMPGKDSFDLIKSLKNHKKVPAIIFVTAFDEYAIDAVRSSAIDYLLKPVNPDELKNSIQRFSSLNKDVNQAKEIDNLIHKLLSRPKIKFNARSGYILLAPDEIVYMQADGSYTHIFLVNGKEHILSSNLGIVEKNLGNKGFFRISRSILINLEYLVKVDRKDKTCVLKFKENQLNLSSSTKQLRLLEKHLEK